LEGVIFIERLKQLREAKNLTQLRLAMELNVSQETISGYEIGKAVPPAEMLVKLADTLDTSVDYLLGRTDIKSTLRASELSEQEAEILTILRRQPEDKRIFVFDLIKGLEK
jgi:transcriptional regulator with XRE-family HTH domain